MTRLPAFVDEFNKPIVLLLLLRVTAEICHPSEKLAVSGHGTVHGPNALESRGGSVRSRKRLKSGVCHWMDHVQSCGMCYDPPRKK